MKKLSVILNIIKDVLGTPSGKFVAVALIISLTITIIIAYHSIKYIVVRTKKGGVAGFLGSIVTVIIIISILFFNDGNRLEDGKVNTVTKQSTSPVQAAPAQPTGDPIKDELLWPVGQFGYHEPPMELRQESINPVTKQPFQNRYSIHLHDERYGDLTLAYNTETGQRTLFEGNDDTKATKKLMIIGENHPITIKEALEDLRIGDGIAKNFGK